MNGSLQSDTEEVSLRPLSLRPGGAAKNPFASFGKGAGAAFRDKHKEDIFAPPVEEKKKPREKVIKYTAEFLTTFSELWNKVPPELKAHPDVLLDTIDSNKPEQPVAPVAPVTDDRDWRARSSAPTPAAEATARSAAAQPAEAPAARQNSQSLPDKAGQQQQRQVPAAQPQKASQAVAAAANAAPQADAALPAIQTAEELGRKAWAPSSSLTSEEKAVRLVKGILNKLTPEKFETLLQQLIQTITTTEILHSTIALVFENAVAQPTFVRMYADLCKRLSTGLSDLEGSNDASRTFRRVLLNTCQEEFEGAANAREGLKQVPAGELEAAQRRVKLRTLGNIRLIAELFNEGIVAEKIVHACIMELLGSAKAVPVEDNAEALCELLTISGKNLDNRTREKKKIEGYFTTLDKWLRVPSLPARIRFLIRDVIELRRSQWVPRREALQAKTLTEIHAEAHAELGMVPTTMMAPLPGLQGLPALQQPLAGLRHEEVELFPAFKHSDEGWASMVGSGKEGGSTLLGDYVDLPAPKPAQSAATSAPAPAAAAAPAAPPAKPTQQPAAAVPKKPAKKLDKDGRKAKVKSMLEEFVVSNDRDEAVTCIQEISEPGVGAELMRNCINHLFELIKAREQESLVQLLAFLVQKKAISKDDFVATLEKLTSQLEDLSLDIPKAPELLGALVGESALEGVLELHALPGLCTKCEGAEPRRSFAAAALLRVQEKKNATKLKEMCTQAKLKAGSFLQADPEFDPPDLPSVADFLSSRKLSSVPV